MLKANEMKVLRKIVEKTKINRIRSQQIRESCDIQPINEWVERRRREWHEYVTGMEAERLVKNLKGQYNCRKISRTSEKNTERLKLNPSLKQAESAITKRRRIISVSTTHVQSVRPSRLPRS